MSANDQLLIPETLKVGFVKRDDTYTKKLGYVIYYDQTGKLRKEKSWEGWRDKNITPVETKNEPTEGFVLNRNVGGVSRYSHSWDQRMEKCRVYDPRGWEFEITIPNLLFILQECTSVKGKGLDGTFVYGWAGTELVLLPTESSEYKSSQKFTKLQSQKISAKSLVVGATYHTKNQQDVVYLGKHDWYELEYGHYSGGKYIDRQTFDYKIHNNSTSARFRKNTGKKFIFYDAKGTYKQVHAKSGITHLAAVVDETPAANYADMFDKFAKSYNASGFVKLTSKPIKPEWFNKEPTADEKKYSSWYGNDPFMYKMNNKNLFKDNGDGTYNNYTVSLYQIVNPNYDGNVDKNQYIPSGYTIRPQHKYSFTNGIMCITTCQATQIPWNEYRTNPKTGRSEYMRKNDTKNYREEIVLQQSDFADYGFCDLFVEFESGAQIPVKDC